MLVTYGWCRTAYIAVRALAARGHKVYSCSHLLPSMTGWSRFCRGSASVSNPFEAPAAFTKEISELVERWDIDVVLPGHEDALVLREFEHLLPDGLLLACPSQQALIKGLDKIKVTRIAQAAGVSVPETICPSSVEEALDVAPALGFPLVLKLAHSNSAKGVAIVRDLDELKTALMERFVAAAIAAGDHFPYLQKFCEGVAVGCCFMARKGHIDGWFGERYLRSKSDGIGTSVFREPFPSAKLRLQAEKIVRALEWDGIGHFDFIENREDGDLVLLEMNPRPWGAINLSLVNGFDFIGATVAHALGEKDLTGFFNSHPDSELRSIWGVGEGIRFAHLLGTCQFSAAAKVPFEVFKSLKNSRFDDLIWHDPLPFLGEAICYGKIFFGSGEVITPL